MHHSMHLPPPVFMQLDNTVILACCARHLKQQQLVQYKHRAGGQQTHTFRGRRPTLPREKPSRKNLTLRGKTAGKTQLKQKPAHETKKKKIKIE